MNQRLSSLLQEWALRDSGTADLSVDPNAIQYLARTLFEDYEPSQFVPFDERLDRWLHNVTDDHDQQTLFHLLAYLFFLGRSEFESLCRAAYNGPVHRWLVELLKIDIADPTAANRLDTAVGETWFCPITDSLRINSFLKVNKLTGKSHRPDWRSLTAFGDPRKILQYTAANRIRRVVLLEDFVGTGTQMRSAVEFAAALSNNLAILTLPLVSCPDADDVGHRLEATHPNVSYTSVITIGPELLIKADAQPGEPAVFSRVRDLISRVKTRLNNPARDPESQRYHGYKGTGAVFATHSNCPDNSLPIISDKTANWDPLFPRIERM